MNPITLAAGRPADGRGRLPREMRCYDALDALGISYTRADHDRADTIEQCRDVQAALGAKICKNLFLCNRQKTDFYLLLLPGEKPFQTKVFSKLIGTSRLSFADPADMEACLDLTPGSVSVLGLMNDRAGRVRLYVDRSVAEETYIGCHPCMNTSTLKLRTFDVLNRFVPSTGRRAEIIDLPRAE